MENNRIRDSLLKKIQIQPPVFAVLTSTGSTADLCRHTTRKRLCYLWLFTCSKHVMMKTIMAEKTTTMIHMDFSWWKSVR